MARAGNAGALPLLVPLPCAFAVAHPLNLARRNPESSPWMTIPLSFGASFSVLTCRAGTGGEPRQRAVLGMQSSLSHAPRVLLALRLSSRQGQVNSTALRSLLRSVRRAELKRRGCRMPLDFLRGIPHLRARTNTLSALTRWAVLRHRPKELLRNDRY
eukprot:3080383-Rhodomonas_salina.2